ncbi:xanthine dehydrogenase family protein subunit M [Cupriavidus sp. BIC8F]|uniref:FAD binding domain-containing protein n=1 Tax=Cupriavidus sp. BIC8F TaxID=3079014 RepID=UPI002916FBF0|nr:xanthine dehydrogenase family protein subunit M [Cupriavidus sp. BIC8F]
MRDFAFLEPATVAEASQMLADLGDSCRILAGGTALMLGMRQRMLTPGHLVSLGRLEALRGITFDAREGLTIGALTLHAEVARSPLVQAHYPMLASMASRVANPQVRNQGTIGGNLCYADPATDPPGCLMAQGARIVVSGRGGEREIDIEDFLVDYYVTALAPDEIVTQIRVPAPGAGADGRYARFLRTAAEHRPLASVALAVRREGAFCVEARLAVGASTPIPARLRRAEALLAGKAVTATLAEEAAAIVAADINAVSDMRGSESYRREMVRVVARRTIAELFGVASE